VGSITTEAGLGHPRKEKRNRTKTEEGERKESLAIGECHKTEGEETHNLGRS